MPDLWTGRGQGESRNDGESSEATGEDPELPLHDPSFLSNSRPLKSDKPAKKAKAPKAAKAVEKVAKKAVKAAAGAVETAAEAVADVAEKVADVAEDVADAADDLSLIDGAGPAAVKKMAAAGITTFKQLAALTEEQLQEALGKIAVTKEFGIQAQELLDGKPPRAKVDQKAAEKAKKD